MINYTYKVFEFGNGCNIDLVFRAIVESFIKTYLGIILDFMIDQVEGKIKSMMLAEETVVFKTDEDIALHVMHRFNIDAETLDCMPAFKEPLQSILWPEKRQ